LLVGNPASRAEPLAILANLGFVCDEADDPYTAYTHLCGNPGEYQAVVLSLASHYKEELAIIQSLKRQFPHVDVWLAQADGRHPAMIEAIRMGADGLLAEDGLHRMAMAGANGAAVENESAANSARAGAPAVSEASAMPAMARTASSNGSSRDADSHRHDRDDDDDLEFEVGEPVLSADELRALLQEQPFLPPHTDDA
jgi:DNA-binding NtrC family response regulator